MSGENPSYKVTKLRAGTVLDHLKPGRALDVLKLLGLAPGATAAIGINFPSGKHGRKDIIKLENTFLTPDEIAILALVSPAATISTIRDFAVVEKREVPAPREVTGVLQCPSASCVTNHESFATTRFLVTATAPLVLVCHYCERSFGDDQLRLLG